MQITLREKYLSENKQTAYLVFELPEVFSFKAGQFVMLDNGVLKRPYSIATSTKEAENKILGFYVKKVSENGMSKFLVEDLKVGDKLNMIGPFGHMVLDNAEKTNYLLVSIGSGLAPILSIAKDIAANLTDVKVINLYGERYFSNIVPKVLEEMSILEKNKNLIFKNIIFLSKENIGNLKLPYNLDFRKGHVQDGLEEAFNFIGDVKNLKVFICGKPAMVDDVAVFLKNKGIKENNIKFEKY